MTALPADIIRATRASRLVIRSDSAIKTLFPGARDGQAEPDPGYFENAADADTVLAIKAALIGAVRGRYIVEIGEEIDIDPFTSIPSFQLTDTELGIDKPALLCRLELDMETETTSIEVLG